MRLGRTQGRKERHFWDVLASWFCHARMLHRSVIEWTPIAQLSDYCGSVGKESACNVGHLSSIPGLGRSPGGGNGNPLQHSCLENPHGQGSLAGYSPWSHRVGHNIDEAHLLPISLAKNHPRAITLSHSLVCVCCGMVELFLTNVLYWYVEKHQGKKQEIHHPAEMSCCQAVDSHCNVWTRKTDWDIKSRAQGSSHAV